jgi:hypothetical protein
MEVQHVKNAMARQVEKEVTALKKELAAAQKKAKDNEEDPRVIVEGMPEQATDLVFR